MRQGRDGLWAIHTLDVEGGHEQRITPVGVNAQDPTGSANGRSIAFVRVRGSNRSSLAVVGSGGGPAKPLDTGFAASFGPAWSPNRSRLAFSAATLVP
jgi:Tol biopolymer transport system component